MEIEEPTEKPAENEMEVERGESSSVASDVSNMSFESVNTTSFSICFHFICRANQSVESQFVNAQDCLTLSQCLTIIQEKTVRAMINPQFRRALDAQPLSPNTMVEDIIQGTETDIFVFFDTVQPVMKETEKAILYETINKYYYVDDKKWVKVYLELEGIGQLPPAQIHSRFLERSFEIKIHAYQGKNWIFAVPKTQCLMLTKDCKVIQKDNKIILRLAKMAQSDNWFSLHKIRCVGEKEDN